MAPRELYNSYTLGELHEWLRQAELAQADSTSKGVHAGGQWRLSHIESYRYMIIYIYIIILYFKYI